MVWDADKNTNDELTSDEWDAHVSEHREIYDPTADEVTADVNNTQTATGTVQVGQSAAVTSGPMADSGEWVILSDARYQNGPWSATSTTFTLSASGADKVTLPVPQTSNISEYAVGFSVQMQNDTAGETTTARLLDFPDAVVSVTGAWDAAQSERHTLSSPPPDAVQADIELKVTAGTGTLEQATLHVWGKMA